MANEIELTHEFTDLNALKNAFMPFVQDGGIFIPTDKIFHLNDSVKITVILPQTKQSFKFSGEVIWIMPKSAHNITQPGIGIQCRHDEGEVFKKVVLELLAAVKDEGAQTDTM